MSVKPLGHHELLLLLLQVAVLLLVARACGELARKLKTPAVVGELTAGVLLGPSVLGHLWPWARATLFPPVQIQSDLLAVVTWLGVILLLTMTGLETDLALIRRIGKRAAMISLGGLMVPFASGLALGYYLPASLLARPDHRFVFMMFTATAMSISAIPVIARILQELGALRRDIGQLTLAAGMIDDTVGWILLSVVAALASVGTLNVWLPLKSVLAVLGLLVFALLIGRRMVAALYRWIDDHVEDPGAMTSVTVVLTLLMASLTLYLGLEAVLGAFVFGMMLREAPRYRPEVTNSLEEITRLVLSPVFFAAAGLKVDLSLFADGTQITYALLVLGTACVGKFVGVFIGSRLSGMGTWEGLAMGSALNARGAMEIIVATIGLSMGVLSVQMYSIIVFVAIATSLMAPPLLRTFLSRVPLHPHEVRRLEREKRQRESFFSGLRKVILPTRGGGNARYAASLTRQFLGGSQGEVTVLGLKETTTGFSFARPPEDNEGLRQQALQVAEQTLKPIPSRQKIVNTEGRSAANVIAEQGRDHDLIVLGASHIPHSTLALFTFSKLIDQVLQLSTRPVLVVRHPGGEQVSIDAEFSDRKIQRILVPTTGTNQERASRELGVILARANQAVCTFLFVEETRLPGPLSSVMLEEEATPHPMAGFSEQEVLEDEEGHVRLELLTVQAMRAGDAIVEVATEGDYDLIVMHAEIRHGSSRAHLGPQVDHVIEFAQCPVAILVTR